MAVNVTQKDQTLTEIIDFCEDVMSVWCRKEGAHARGYREALAEALGWHRYEQPDGDPKHICPECAGKEFIK